MPIANDKLEPVFLLCPKNLASNCEEFLSSGERKLESWIKSNNFQTVDFEEKNAFFNYRTGVCYIETNVDKLKAKTFIELAVSEPNVDKMLYFNYAKSLAFHE